MNVVNNIPKVIHYCWFGGKPLSEIAQRCIASWKRFCPDYKIVEWNEDNYNLDTNTYISEAYKAKKWAFVSDYARFDILYRFGGIYFDTDVELIKPIDDIIALGPFMGCENLSKSDIEETDDKCDVNIAVAPGLGIAAISGMELYREILNSYEGIHFIDGEKIDTTTVAVRITSILIQHGFQKENKLQYIAGVYIYPYEYFCPMNCNTGKLIITENTRSIHHYSASWHTPLQKMITAVRYKTTGKGEIISVIGHIISFPLRMANKIKNKGWKMKND